MDRDPVLCLDCARRKLSGKPAEPCSKCLMLNVDPTAQVRALCAMESPIKKLLEDTTMGHEFNYTNLPQKPARPNRRGGCRL